MERGNIRKSSGGNRNCKNFILLTKIKLENYFQYLPLWSSKVNFFRSRNVSKYGLKATEISSLYLNQNKSYDKKKKNYTVKKNLFFSCV